MTNWRNKDILSKQNMENSQGCLVLGVQEEKGMMQVLWLN